MQEKREGCFHYRCLFYDHRTKRIMVHNIGGPGFRRCLHSNEKYNKMNNRFSCTTHPRQSLHLNFHMESNMRPQWLATCAN
jgi:hypothetical protein